MFLVDMVRRLISQTRICPKCGHRQGESVDGRRRDRCERCGAPLPPPKEGGKAVKS